MNNRINVFVGRQPIYNREMEVIAYELLFRGGGSHTSAQIVDADQATSQVILNTFMEIGLERIVGRLPAFINLTRGFLSGKYQLLVPPERVVLEVLEDIEVDEDLIANLRALSSRGYKIALDDFIYEQRYKDLIDVADIVKIDLLALDRDTLKKDTLMLRQHEVKLLAEKVETPDDFEFCKGLGFDYFQGFFFAKAKTISFQRAPTSRLAVLRTLAKVQDPGAGIAELDDYLSQDISLKFKLLNYINSNQFTLAQRIDSVRRALVLLGVKNIRNWLSLIALAGISDKPDYLLINAMIRAKMCELIAHAAKIPNQEDYFTAGLFSSLDTLLEAPMEEILSSLPLSGDIGQAILSQAGTLGDALACVLRYERGAWDEVSFAPLDPDVIKDCYLTAIAWASETAQALASSAPLAGTRPLTTGNSGQNARYD